MVFLGVSGVTTVEYVLSEYRKELPNLQNAGAYQPALTTTIYSSDGHVLATLYREHRLWTAYEDIPPVFIKALLATEDSRFYEHHGVDFIGVFRAIGSALKAGQADQGASTITMQLARALLLSPVQSKDRKLKEVLAAIEIENTFTKKEILELYVNQIYFGAGCHGLYAATQTYFNKLPKDLTLAEASILAGLPQAPSRYSPFVNFKATLERQKQVLQRMVTAGYITPKQQQEARDETLKFEFSTSNTKHIEVFKVPYFTSYVIRELHKLYPEEILYRGGLKVYTTVDLSLQKKAQEILDQKISQSESYLNVHNGALVFSENENGYIRALIGGRGWTIQNQFNRAYQALRQPGSSFKTIVYTAGLESGMSPTTPVVDKKITMGNWSPNNSDGKFFGAMNLATAMRLSRNTVAVQVASKVGPEIIGDYAKSLGIERDIPKHLAIALGAVDVTPIEMCQVVSCFPNRGLKVPLTAIKMIQSPTGETIYNNTLPTKTEVISPWTASAMMTMMQGVVTNGTAPSAKVKNHQVAGKTGTTDSYRDAWFVGYSKKYSCAVWTGNDDYTKMWRAFGGDVPARIFHDLMEFALRNEPPSKLPIEKYYARPVLLCQESNQRRTSYCPSFYRKDYGKLHRPPNPCRVHNGYSVAVSSLALPQAHNPNPTTESPSATSEQPEEPAPVLPTEILEDAADTEIVQQPSIGPELPAHNNEALTPPDISLPEVSSPVGPSESGPLTTPPVPTISEVEIATPPATPAPQEPLEPPPPAPAPEPIQLPDLPPEPVELTPSPVEP